MWEISLDLNVASSIFLPLISFQEASWYFLVCYVQSIITKTRALLKWSSLCAKQSQRIVMYCCSTINITTVSYQNISHLYYRKIHLKRYISYYFTLNYDGYLILDIFYIKLSWTFFSQKYWICSFVVFSNIAFLQQSKKSTNFDYSQQQQIQKPN